MNPRNKLVRVKHDGIEGEGLVPASSSLLKRENGWTVISDDEATTETPDADAAPAKPGKRA